MPIKALTVVQKNRLLLVPGSAAISARRHHAAKPRGHFFALA
jgi:hypothetical protein